MSSDPFARWRPKNQEISEEQSSPPGDPLARWRPGASTLKTDQESSFSQKIAKSAPFQAILGGLKRLTYPLDVLKLASLGEGLSGLDELEEVYRKAGKEFDRDEYISRVFEAADAMPTQELGERFIREKTGLDLSPQGTLGKIARGTGEIASLRPGSLLEGGSKAIGKRAGAAAGGATFSEGLKQAGVPDPIADVTGFALGGGLESGKLVSPKITPEAEKAVETAEKFGLRKFAGVEAEKPPKITPVVSKGRQEKITKELAESSKSAINKIIEQKLPYKSMRERGYDLEKGYTSAYEAANKTAKRIDSGIEKGTEKAIDYKPVIDWIKQENNRIKSSAPSLSDQDKIALNVLEKELKQLTNPPTKKPIILGPTGKPIPISKDRIPKTSNASQILDQYKNFNENVEGIYRKPEFTGAEDRVRSIYGQLNKKLIDSLENSGKTDLAQELKFANKIFSETQKLNQVESILGKSFDQGYSPKKLLTTLGGKRNRAFLERNLGRKSVQDLKDIASYGERAERMVLKQLKNPKTVGQILSEMTPLKAGLLAIKHVLAVPAIFYEVPKAVMTRASGLLFTRAGTQKAYKDFLKGVSTGSKSFIKKASQGLTDAIEKEFGSEEDLLKEARS